MSPSPSSVRNTSRGPSSDLATELDLQRRALRGFCYRMLGSVSEAEDAVQETMLRAWKAADAFAGRSSMRTWLFRIAHNVCVDMHRAPQRRARPMDLGPSTRVGQHSLDVLEDTRWVQPVADDTVLEEMADPADLAVARESIRLAFVAALQHLPAKQRAALVLCDVFRWPAVDAATLLDTTTASVNSALQRARATLAARQAEPLDSTIEASHRDLLARYMAAFERYDVDELISLMRSDVVLSMPPHAMWLQGTDQVAQWFSGPGAGCAGARLVPLQVNGTGGFANYRAAGPDRWEPFAIQVIECRDGVIVGHHNFLGPERFADFDLPPFLTADMALARR